MSHENSIKEVNIGELKNKIREPGTYLRMSLHDVGDQYKSSTLSLQISFFADVPNCSQVMQDDKSP